MSQKRTMSAAELLRDLRTKQGRSLRGAAYEIGIAPSHLSRLERGERSVTEEVGHRLADYYGVSADLVVKGGGRIPQDVVEILTSHPELIEKIRKQYSGQKKESSGLERAK